MFFQLKISLPAALREPVTAVLYDMGCEGIEEKDDALIAYFPDSASLDEIRDALSGFDGLSFSNEAVEEKDWQAEWKERFECVRAAGFLICPPWKAPSLPAPPAGEKLLLLDPGNAFGAGDHVTTLTVLKLLKKWADKQENLKENLNTKSLLDLGTGTGILAIGACMMGVGDVTAVDTDASSVEATENNFALNGLAGKARIIHGDIRDAGAGYDVVLANIFLEPLLELMHLISAVLKPGGTLIISGLLVGQEEAVLREADREGLLIVESVIENGWFSATLTLTAGHVLGRS
ncbi:MAG: 50S ribosomal protein L11 methyltransferase [Nitrospirota bacterium]